jgi:hypothetical protein
MFVGDADVFVVRQRAYASNVSPRQKAILISSPMVYAF